MLMLALASNCASAQAPNILFVIADDFGLDASPCHPSIGSLKPSMPNLQALCAQGVVFDNAWAYPVCTPTRASVLTGRYGIHTNVMQVDEVLPTTFETILQRVSKAPTPYANAVIGKWHVSGNNAAANSPSLYGAQYYAGFLTGALSDYYAWTLTTNGQTSSQTTYATTVFTDLAINWVSTQTKPWLLWLAYNAPHTPFHVPPAGLHSQPGLTSSSSDRSKYFAAAEALDHELGRLLISMSTAVRSNTVVVFIGDNGTPPAVVQAPFSRTHAKDSLYEGGIRVPMVVAGAGVTRQGQRVTALINSTDLFATFSELAKSSTSNPADSVSFAQALSSATFSGRSHAYMDFRDGGVVTTAVRDAQYKLIDFGSNNRELYNLKIDPYEATNLLLPATAATYTSTVTALLAKIAEFGAAASDPIDYSDMWWVGPSEDGWGMAITQHTPSNQQFNAFYVYDANGQPLWYVMAGGSWSADFKTFTGAIYKTDGSPLDNFVTANVRVDQVGSGSINFTSASTAVFTYTIGATTGTKNIVRQPFGTVDNTPGLQVGDLWWGGQSQSGSGFSIAQQYRTLFGAWYTYNKNCDLSQQRCVPTWYVMSGGAWGSGATANTYTGALYATVGSPWLGTTYDPAALRVTPVGSVSFAFTPDTPGATSGRASNATMTYTFTAGPYAGTTQVKQMTRQPF